MLKKKQTILNNNCCYVKLGAENSVCFVQVEYQHQDTNHPIHLLGGKLIALRECQGLVYGGRDLEGESFWVIIRESHSLSPKKKR